MPKSTGKNIRRNARTVSEKAGSKGVKVSEHGAQVLIALAKKLYDGQKEAHREAGLHKPSSRVALDFLITQAIIKGVPEMSKISIKGNMWQAIGPAPQEE